MNGKPRRGSRLWRRARLGLVTLAAIAGTGPACLSRPVEPLEPRTTSIINERLTQSSVDKIDLLLAIDNSASMGDKQDILNKAVPDLVGRLVNPVCVDPDTEKPIPSDQQPKSPTDDCPGTSRREFDAVLDIHIGIVSSSLGNHGSPDGAICPEQPPMGCAVATTDDHAHLITRTDPCSGAVGATYQNLGFLAWDPKQKKDPPGETDFAKLTATIADLVTGTGQIGCGLEAQNESWYRFLVDPSPYASLGFQAGKTVPQGRDDELLKERADFLRPDSLLAIVMLTDENDCSVQDRGAGWAVATSTYDDGSGPKAFTLPHGSSVCATNPNDKCCYSCGSSPPSGCDPDPSCTPKAATDDKLNLRCYGQKRRFGIDFLYPVQRYVNALTQPTLNPARADLAVDGKGPPVPNPIFSDLDPNDDDVNVRASDLVFLAGIVGVPWQDIAKDPNDLGQGFKTVDELADAGADGVSGWDMILGDPTGGAPGKPPIPPKDPHMIESTTPRPGLPDANAADGADPVSGHEYTTSTLQGDLEYACIFNLIQPKDCSKEGSDCDCNDAETNTTNPLCEPNPNDPDGGRTLQVRAKAYPGLRHLQILKGLGAQGIVASVCAKQLTDDKASDYGYRPAIVAIIDKLKRKLRGQCLPRTLTATEGKVPCVIIEASKSDDPASCNQCNAPAGRQPVDPIHAEAVAAAKENPLNETAHWNCFCEMTQLGGDEQKACQTDTQEDKDVSLDGQPVNGWCYVDPGAGLGDPALVEQCDSAEKRQIRFVGPEGGARSGSTLFITCSGDSAE